MEINESNFYLLWVSRIKDSIFHILGINTWYGPAIGLAIAIGAAVITYFIWPDQFKSYLIQNIPSILVTVWVIAGLILFFAIKAPADLAKSQLNKYTELKNERDDLASKLKQKQHIAQIISDLADFHLEGLGIQVGYEIDTHISDHDVWERFRQWDAKFQVYTYSSNGIGKDYYALFEDETGLDVGELPTLATDKRRKYWRHIGCRLIRLKEFRKEFRDKL